MYGANDFSITPREIFFSETESYSFLIIRKSNTNADSIIEAFDKFITLANSSEDRHQVPDKETLAVIFCGLFIA